MRSFHIPTAHKSLILTGLSGIFDQWKSGIRALGHAQSLPTIARLSAHQPLVLSLSQSVYLFVLVSSFPGSSNHSCLYSTVSYSRHRNAASSCLFSDIESPLIQPALPAACGSSSLLLIPELWQMVLLLGIVRYWCCSDTFQFEMYK